MIVKSRFLILVCFMLMMFLFTFEAYGSELMVKTQPDGSGLEVAIIINGVEGVCGGGITIAFDESSMRLTGSELGHGLSGIAAFVNPDFASGRIRLSWASVEPISLDCTLLTLTFDCDVQMSAKVSIESIKLSDTDGNIIDVPVTKVESSPDSEPESAQDSGHSSRTDVKSKKAEAGGDNLVPSFLLHYTVFKQVFDVIIRTVISLY